MSKWAVKCISLKHSNHGIYTEGKVYISDDNGRITCDTGSVMAGYKKASGFINFSLSKFEEVDARTAENPLLIEME